MWINNTRFLVAIKKKSCILDVSNFVPIYKKGCMKKVPNDKFLKELNEIKPLLPKRYNSLVEFLYPGKFSKDDIYNVIHHGVEDKEVLKALKRVVKKTKAVI